MIVRIVLVLFTSIASGVCYLAGYTRLTSGLLIGFGSLASFFFGILFLLPENNRNLWFPLYGEGVSWPFFLLAVLLAAAAGLTFLQKKEEVGEQQLSALHLQYLVGAVLAYLLNVFLCAFFWFPSDAKRLQADEATLLQSVLFGTALYVLGTIVSLYLFYKASQGTADRYPDLMRRLVLALFAGFHFDKFPAFIAFLLIYSPETQVIYPWSAALALSAYLPVSLFLLKLSWQTERKTLR